MVFLRAVKVGTYALHVNEKKIQYYLEQKHGRRNDAEFLRRMIRERRLGNVPLDEVRKLTRDIDKAADAYNRLAELAGSGFEGSRLFDKAQFAAKGFAIEMTKTMQGLYGSPMYGTVATIAQVALNDNRITTPGVRSWVHSEES